MPLAAGDRLSSRYNIVRLLGEGGMGEVYLARDTTLERDVAVKVLPAKQSDDATARERFRREALAAASLDHPFICKVFEIGEADGRLFIVMEFVAGETLHASLARGPMPSGPLLALAIELTEALEAAHARQLVHRDLKPANIMLTSQRHAKVMDFGLAKLLAHASGETRLGGGPITDQGARVGTPAYMSPEQIAGDPVDHRSDIFSLGVLLIEAVTGVHPFMRSTIAGTMTAVLNDPPLVHSTVSVGEMPPSLRAILLRMLAKAPEARYQSVSEIRPDLQSLSRTDDAGASLTPDAGSGVRPHRWPMVGREAERAELVQHLDRALGGQGGVVMIGGEPGIGKTRLIEELLTEARRRGASGLVGHCYEMQGSPPYVPFVEITEYTARIVPPVAMRRLLGDDAPEVTRLMPELRRMFPDIAAPIELPAEQQRWFFFNAYRAFVDRACRIAPIVAVFEDLHWADEPTLHLLLHVAQTVASMPLLIVGTYRDVELETTRPFAKALETLLRKRLGTRIALRRLEASGVEALLAAMSGRPAPPSLSRVVYRETEGNPFFVEEVFHHLAEEGRLFSADGTWRSDMRVETLDVPEGVRLVIGRRLDRLGETARRILTTGAVLGRVFSLALLERLESGPGGAGPDAVLDAVEEAERAHLVRAHSAGRDAQYIFEHELIRQTLADALSMPRRQRLHGRIALAIEDVYAANLSRHVPALAHHFYQAGAAVDAGKTTQYLIQAADAARATAGHEEALGYLDNALGLWEGESSERVADLLDRRGAALASLGRGSEALVARKQAAALWQQFSKYGRYATSMGAVFNVLGWAMDFAGAEREMSAALQVLADAPASLCAPLLYMQAWVTAGLGAAAEGTQKHDEVEALRKTLADPELDALATLASANISWTTFRLSEAATLQRQAMDMMTSLGRPWEALDASFILVWSALYQGQPERAAALIDELEPAADRIGHRGAQWALLSGRPALLAMTGDLAAAEREGRRVLEFGQRHEIPWAYHTRNVLGNCLFARGKTDEALAFMREAVEREGRSYFCYGSRGILFRALSYVAPDEAHRYYREMEIALPATGTVNALGNFWNLVNVAEGLHTLGDLDALARLMPLVDLLNRPDFRTTTFMAMPQAAAGLIASAAGAWEIAEARFQTALAICESCGVVLHQGTTREWYADMLMVRGAGDDPARANALYVEAAEHYARLGMRLFATRLGEKRRSLAD